MKMKKILLLLFITVSSISFGQDYYNPQVLYSTSGSFFDLDSIRTIEINFYDPNYDSILQSNWELGTGLNLPASIQLSNGEYYDSVGVRYKGNSTFSIAQSLQNPKFPLNIDVNDYIPGQTLMNIKDIKLANAFLDPTFCKEITGLNIYRNYLPSPEANLIKVYVQGVYLGLYVNTESINKQFLNKHFNENDGVFFKCDPVQQFGQIGPAGNADLGWRGTDTTLYYNDYDLKSPTGWTEMRDLIYTLNFTPELIDSVLNVDRVLWAFAANTVTANLDTYNGLFQHNYYMYQTQDGLFQMIPWDLSESFEGAVLGYTQTPDSMYEYDPYQGFNCLNTPLVTRLIANTSTKYSKIYTAHVRTILEEKLDSLAIKGFIDPIQSQALPAVNADTNKLFSLFEYYYNVGHHYIIPGVISLGGITSTANIRSDFLLANPEISKVPPSISNVQILDQGGVDYVTAYISNESSVELMTTTSVYNSKFVSTTMYDNGTNGDLVAGDHIYTAVVPDQMGDLDVKFYIRAQNGDAYKLNPERAEYEFYIYNKLLNVAFQQNQNGYLVYPNSTKSYINIDSKNELIQSYKICTIYGEPLVSDSISQNKLTLDLSEYSAGVYLLYVNDRLFKVIKE